MFFNRNNRSNRNNVRAAGFVRRLMMTGAVLGLVFAAGCARQTTRTFKEVDLGSPIPVEAEARPGSVTTPVSWTDKDPDTTIGQVISSSQSAFSIFRALASAVFVSLPCRRGAESRNAFISTSFTSASLSALRGPPHCLSEK